MTSPEILRLPNLLSLSRVVLVLPIAYYLWRGDDSSSLVAMGLMIVAGITDGLDGIVARKMKSAGSLGVTLDPVCDKLFAGGLVILLAIYRDLPLWLASLILGRDLLILAAGWFLMRGRRLVLPSNLTGKYAFAATIVLLASYVLRLSACIWLIAPIVVVLLIASTVNYARVFASLRRGKTPPVFVDRRILRVVRITAAVAIIAWCLSEAARTIWWR
jgi:CDP-diacylglycerol--glycerol-3-phosphate 3-phosphatidyltransferase